jgi:glycosyltransferase involved in cell wall biosynthesis
MIKFSIITINFNNKIGLTKTIKSVLNQTFEDFEYIIIDGGSNDGSKELIESISDKLSFWVSEKDNGIYNAMNKGINAAKGNYIQFLNSGDTLANENVLEYISKNIYDTNSQFDFYYTDVINQQNKKIHYYPTHLTFKHFFEFTINHQATFFKYELFKKYGNYSEHYKIVSDWEFYMKILFLHNATYLHLPEPAVLFDFSDGISTSSNFTTLMNNERSDVFKKHFINIIDDYVFFKNIELSNTWKFIQKINKIKSKVFLKK